MAGRPGSSERNNHHGQGQEGQGLSLHAVPWGVFQGARGPRGRPCLPCRRAWGEVSGDPPGILHRGSVLRQIPRVPGARGDSGSGGPDGLQWAGDSQQAPRVHSARRLRQDSRVYGRLACARQARPRDAAPDGESRTPQERRRAAPNRRRRLVGGGAAHPRLEERVGQVDTSGRGDGPCA